MSRSSPGAPGPARNHLELRRQQPPGCAIILPESHQSRRRQIQRVSWLILDDDRDEFVLLHL